MRRFKLSHSINILIIILGLSITVKKISERFFLGDEDSCLYYNDCIIKPERDNCTYLYSKGTNESGDTDISFRFSGMDTIWGINSRKEIDVVFKYNSVIKDGDFKVVLINPDESISEILNGSEEGEITHLIKPGKTKVMIVGNKVSGSLKLRLCYNKDCNCVEVLSAFI